MHAAMLGSIGVTQQPPPASAIDRGTSYKRRHLRAWRLCPFLRAVGLGAGLNVAVGAHHAGCTPVYKLWP